MVTYTSSILTDIGKQLPYLKLIGKSSYASGTVALFRNENDGNAYEIDIRPASLAQHKDIWGDIITKRIERKSFNPNKAEPLRLHDVTKIIQDHFTPLYNKISLKRNTPSDFLFRVYLRSDVTIEQITEASESLEHVNYFSIDNFVNTDPLRRYIVIRYTKLSK